MKRPSFSETIETSKIDLSRRSIQTLQVNLGKRCNQACLHCHVEAGPKRTENMERRTLERILNLLDISNIRTVDLTGGAPELNPDFRWFVSELAKRGLHIIDRCNLTVLFETGQEETAAFLAHHKVEVVASLPCYTKDNVEKQRGRGVFGKSIEALKKLNDLGYGKEGSGLILNLVYNPLGASLPPPQEKLEADYKRQLFEDFEIRFNSLFTITNMPVKRFLEDLHRQNKFEEYMGLLVEKFNPQAATEVMCRDLVSVGYDGQLFDCDFNQMLEIPLAGRRQTLFDVASLNDLFRAPIALGDHCFGCTAGSGSSCGGALS